VTPTKARSGPIAKRIVASLAFGGWCFANVFTQSASGYLLYFSALPPRTLFLPVVVLITLIATSIFGLLTWIDRRASLSPFLEYLFLGACLFPLGFACLAFLPFAPEFLIQSIRHVYFWPAVFLLGTIPVWLVLKHRTTAVRGARAVLYGTFPGMAVLAGYCVYNLSPALYLTPTPVAQEPSTSAPPTTRVVWILFDELSQAVAFDKRPDGLSLPNFDRMKNQSLYATAAKAPADMTELSIPSLLLGQMITESRPAGPAELQVKTSSSAFFDFATAPNLFDKLAREGIQTAVVGWHHPYCRLFGARVEECAWTPTWLGPAAEQPIPEGSLLDAMTFRVRMQLVAFPFIGRLPALSPLAVQRREKRNRVEYLLTQSRQYVADPRFGLVFLHLPIPHPPAITGNGSYQDGIRHADQILGELRKTMEARNLWDSSSVIISTDHSWRPHLWKSGVDWTPQDSAIEPSNSDRIPFLLKLPGQAYPVVYNREWNTVSTANLINGLLLEPWRSQGANPAALLDRVLGRNHEEPSNLRSN
jgi:hypothetical protein